MIFKCKFSQACLIILYLSWTYGQDFLPQNACNVKDANQYFNNIEYLGSGYNAVYANPSYQSGLDPGYRKYNAFVFQYDSQNRCKNYNAEFNKIVPNSVDVKQNIGCTSAQTEGTISNEQELQKKISAGATISAVYGLKSFTGNADYQYMIEKIAKTKSSFIDSTAICNIYELTLQNNLIYTEDLKIALKKIIELGTYGEVFQFFEDFGTHVTKSVIFGARYRSQIEITERQMEQLENKNFTANIAAQGWGTSTSARTTQQTNELKKLANYLSSLQTESLGAAPDPTQNADKWASQSIESPMPVKGGKFQTWPEALEKSYKFNKFSDSDYSRLKTLINKSYSLYCSRYLIHKGIVSRC